MNAPQPAHSPFGGSVATRVLRCPASVGLVSKVPAELGKPSIYADRGSALHTATALLIENQITLDALIGRTLGAYTISRDDVENSLRPVLAYVERLLDAPGAEYYLEKRVTFPTIAGAFGTADLIIRTGSTIYVIDFKFGSGVRVLALYPDSDGDLLNAQLTFYCAAARHSLPEFFVGVEAIHLVIVQPTSIEEDAEVVSEASVTHAELDEFITLYRAACEEALGPMPRLERGAHCRFCAGRPICPAHTGPLLHLAQFTAADSSAFGSKDEYLRVLAEGLNLVDAIKDLRTALHDQAKRALERGEDVPGYALSAGRAVRRWHDESAAFNALSGVGLDYDDLIEERMRSPKQVELRAKARGLRVPTELIGSYHSGLSLVKGENVRVPVAGRGEIVRLFTLALDAFQKGESIHD